jgi:hypothetical protein
MESALVTVVAGIVAAVAAVSLVPLLTRISSSNASMGASPLLALGIGIAPIFIMLYARYNERKQGRELKLWAVEANESVLFKQIDVDLAPVFSEVTRN